MFSWRHAGIAADVILLTQLALPPSNMEPDRGARHREHSPNQDPPVRLHVNRWEGKSTESKDHPAVCSGLVLIGPEG